MSTTWVTPAGWDCAYQLVRGYPSPQDADVAVIERPLGLEGDLDRLFAVGGHGSATLGILGEVDDPEPKVELPVPMPVPLVLRRVVVDEDEVDERLPEEVLVEPVPALLRVSKVFCRTVLAWAASAFWRR